MGEWKRFRKEMSGKGDSRRKLGLSWVAKCLVHQAAMLDYLSLVGSRKSANIWRMKEKWLDLCFRMQIQNEPEWKWFRWDGAVRTYVVVLVSKLCLTLLRSHGLWPTRFLRSWDSPGKNTGVGCHFLLRGSSQPRDGIQGLNLCLLYWQVDSSPLNHQVWSCKGWS